MHSLEEYFRGKTVSLLGAGVSNLPLAHTIAPFCSRLVVRDKKSEAELGDAAVQLKNDGAILVTGEDYLKDLCEDCIFRSPGMRPDMPELAAARESGHTVTSEMEFFLSLEPCHVFGITGSDGKSTTTTLTYLMLKSGAQEQNSSRNTFLGGNIGKPLLDRYSLIEPDDCAAVELSSFQLMSIDALVEAAAITNITPNHLNWHTSMEEYIAAKKRILRHAGRAVLNYDNDVTREIAKEAQDDGIPVTFFSLHPIPDGVLGEADSKIWLEGEEIFTLYPDEEKSRLMLLSDIKLPGLHNAANYMTAAALTHGLVSPEKIREIARTFGGVEHRLEFVREKDGVSYINGSIDSSPTRTAAALSALNGRSIVLIAGGYDKNIPYEPLAEAVYSSGVHTIVLTGATSGKIRSALTSHPSYGIRELKIIDEPDFDMAVARAAESAKTGDVVILSPASASFDRFKNFEERGRHFKDLVNNM